MLLLELLLLVARGDALGQFVEVARIVELHFRSTPEEVLQLDEHA